MEEKGGIGCNCLVFLVDRDIVTIRLEQDIDCLESDKNKLTTSMMD